MEFKGSALNRAQFWSQADPNYVERLGQPGSCLVMVPHPDDESLACAGLIKILVDLGVSVQVILTTDGSGSHPHSKRYPAQKLFELRKQELELALGLLGIEPSAIKYYKAKDGNMPTTGELGFKELISQLKDDLRELQPDLILVPYEQDSHHDHKATHQLLIAAMDSHEFRRPKVWEYPIWLYERAEFEEVPILEDGELIAVDIAAHLQLKKECIYAHRSQTTQLIDDDPQGFFLSPQVIDHFIQKKEYFMEREKLNPRSTLSKTYFDDVYANSPDPWNFETSDYEREKYLATISAIPIGNYPKAFEIGCSIGVLTEMLVDRCGHLVAMDISKAALARANERLSHLSTKVDLILGGVPDAFPSGNFDLIVMSEVGYYFAKNDLLRVSKQIWNGLNKNGVLVLVHWIHFVQDYPLSGDDVHNSFNELEWAHPKELRTTDYRLDVYRKL